MRTLEQSVGGGTMMGRWKAGLLLGVLLGAAGCQSDGATGATAPGEAVGDASLEQTGTAELDGDTIVVQLANGPVRLHPAADTTFFVCETEDDCEEVDEQTFRNTVSEGDTIRVLGPNAELIGPETAELPPALWVVLDRTID